MWNSVHYPTTNISISITLHSCHMTWSHGTMGCFVCSMLFWTWPDVRERQRAAWVIMVIMCVCSWVPALSVWLSWPFAGPDQTTSNQDQTAHLDEEEPNHHNIISEGQTIRNHNEKSHRLQERAAFHKHFCSVLSKLYKAHFLNLLTCWQHLWLVD